MFVDLMVTLWSENFYYVRYSLFAARKVQNGFIREREAFNHTKRS